jgi:hypothetical protein
MGGAQDAVASGGLMPKARRAGAEGTNSASEKIFVDSVREGHPDLIGAPSKAAFSRIARTDSLALSAETRRATLRAAGTKTARRRFRCRACSSTGR